MTEEATLARCDARIHLESVGVENPNLFDEWNSSNSEKMDSWYRRSLYVVIENDIEDWGKKVRKVKEAVIWSRFTRGRTRPAGTTCRISAIGAESSTTTRV